MHKGRIAARRMRRTASHATVCAACRGGRSPENKSSVPPGMTISFGATRVGALIGRVRLHVTTQRFLAARRGDNIWEASCDYAALALDRLSARLRPEVFAAELFPAPESRRTRRAR